MNKKNSNSQKLILLILTWITLTFPFNQKLIACEDESLEVTTRSRNPTPSPDVSTHLLDLPAELLDQIVKPLTFQQRAIFSLSCSQAYKIVHKRNMFKKKLMINSSFELSPKTVSLLSFIGFCSSLEVFLFYGYKAENFITLNHVFPFTEAAFLTRLPVQVCRSSLLVHTKQLLSRFSKFEDLKRIVHGSLNDSFPLVYTVVSKAILRATGKREFDTNIEGWNLWRNTLLTALPLEGQCINNVTKSLEPEDTYLQRTLIPHPTSLGFQIARDTLIGVAAVTKGLMIRHMIHKACETIDMPYDFFLSYGCRALSMYLTYTLDKIKVSRYIAYLLYNPTVTLLETIQAGASISL